MEQQQTHHYHLISGEIFFRHKNSEEILTTRLNGVLADPNREIPVRLLSKAQQILQLQFFQMMGDEAKDTNVVNCVILNFSYLGEFTSAEFHKEPEGTVLQEVSAEQQPPADSSSSTSSPKLRVVPGKSLEQAIEEAKQS